MSAWAGWRAADHRDLVALHDLERAAGLAAHAAIFPRERYPFPSDDVLARWRIVLDDDEVRVRVVDLPGRDGLAALVAWDDVSLRHVAVRPDHWRQGLATTAVEGVIADLHGRGVAELRLWVLEDNAGARRLYERLGWALSGERQVSPWPPHPTEVGYRHVLDDGACP